jgi:UDP-glucose 4-epimerase
VRILVTGGAGFIGSTLVDRLLDEAHQVVVLDNLSSGTLSNTQRARGNGAYRFVEHDITDPSTIDVVRAAQPDVVVHLAAQIDVRISVDDPARDAQVNLLGGLHVLEGARRGQASRFVFVSSGGAIYGDAPESLLPLDESTPRHPLSPYGASKKAFGDYLEVYRQLHGLSSVTVAPANVYGPRQGVGGEGGVVAIFCKRAIAGEPCIIFGDGETTRDFVHVNDVVDAIVRAMTAGSGLYNVGTGVETSLNELFELVKQAMDGTTTVIYRDERIGDIRRSALDASRARAELGWRPQVSLASGVASVLDFFAPNRPA